MRNMKTSSLEVGAFEDREGGMRKSRRWKEGEDSGGGGKGFVEAVALEGFPEEIPGTLRHEIGNKAEFNLIIFTVYCLSLDHCG